MTGVHNFPPGTQVDCIPEEASLRNWEESQIILEAAPLDVARAISKFFDNAALFPRNDRIQAESDSGSGDSLFITQVPTPKVKKAHRLQRRPRDEQHALGVVTSVLQAQSAHGARKRPKYVKKKSMSNSQPKKKWKMRWYSFGFLPCIYNKRSTSRSKQRRIRKPRTSLRSYYNVKLHSSVIGGFFKCVKTHQLTAKHNESRDTQLPSLPRRCIDEGVTLSPLSEEDEIADDGDIKVVKLNRFATSSKPRLKKTNPPSQRAPQRQGNATNVNADITQELSQVQSSADPWPSQSHAIKLYGKRSDSLFRVDTAAQEQINVDFSQCGLTTQGDDSQLKKKRKRKKEHRALDLQLTGHLEESSTIHSDDASTQKRRTSEMCTTGQIKDSGDSQKCTNGNQKATECSSVKGVEVTSKKKKNKKMSETSTTDRVDCGVVQNEHSASVEKTGTNGTGSFLFGDTVEKDYNAHEETTVSFPAKKKKSKKCKNRAGLSTSGFDMDVVENIDDSQEAVVAPNGIALKKKKNKQLLCFTGLCLEESFVKNGEEFEAHKYQSNSVSETMSLNETGLTFKKKKKYKKKEN